MQKNNQNPGISIFDKKVKGIVYWDKSTASFFPFDLKFRSRYQVQPCRQNTIYSDLSAELSTNPVLPKNRTNKNLFWVLPNDTKFSWST